MLKLDRREAGFTLTETMVVVVILSLLAALSTPLFTRDNTARKGSDFAKVVAQFLQRARFQAMGDHLNIHVQVYRTRLDMYRQNPPGSPTPYTLLSTINGPVADDTRTVAIWDAVINAPATLPAGQNMAFRTSPVEPTSPTAANDIVFTPLGSTADTRNWRVFVRNELLPSAHPDSSFVIEVRGLTGYIASNEKVTLP
jgi:prepilin-type N-terminal cleavage/methylation domain-containing protein